MIKSFFLVLTLLLVPMMAHAQVAPQTMVAPPSTELPAPAPAPVVLELFTSQGCAFCPPADKLMGQMAEQPGIIGLSCHVDYFNVRKNSLGQGFCTQRQNIYNRVIGTGPRYTPQLIVNGHLDMIGYEGGKISAAILKARAEKTIPIILTKAGEGSYSFSLPATSTNGQSVKLWLAAFDKPKDITITEGSNLGKKVTYYNVVSRIEDLGVWDGAGMARAVNANYMPANAGIAIIAQNMVTGRIIAAGSIKR